MRVVVINGQNHKGTTYHIGQMVLEELNVKSEDVTEFFLPKDLPNACRGCFVCMRNGETKCPDYENYIKPITKAIDEADLLFFTTPTYCMRATSGLRALFEHYFTWWMSHRPKANMFNKKAIVVSTCAGAGAGAAVKDVAVNLENWGLSYILKIPVAAHAASWSDVDSKMLSKITNKVKKAVKKINKDKDKIVISTMTKVRFWFYTGMQKNNWSACKEDYDYWKNNGWLDGVKPWEKQ